MVDVLRLLKEAIQSNTMAPPMRRSVTTSEVTAPLAISNLERGDISPRIVFAPSMEACPFQQNFSIYSSNDNFQKALQN